MAAWTEDEADPWLDPDTEIAVRAGITGGLPARSLGLYGRWWQLETWLRDLVYVELRARDGLNWVNSVKAAIERQTQDAIFTHMSSSDSSNPLTYLDYSQLLMVIDANWNIFEHALIEKSSWDGRQPELKRIRHRIGHMRRPHPDDLGRVEQMLRDLERGAFVTLASYNEEYEVDPAVHSDPITKGWIAGEHPSAQRLIAHALQQYDISIDVLVARRPWLGVSALTEGIHLPGLLWRINFSVRRREVHVANLWRDVQASSVLPLLVHLLADDPWHFTFTFSAGDDPATVSDAIGSAFDIILKNSYPPRDNPDKSIGAWQKRWANVDYRLLSGTKWNLVDLGTVPICIFGAGGGVTSVPKW